MNFFLKKDHILIFLNLQVSERLGFYQLNQLLNPAKSDELTEPEKNQGADPYVPVTISYIYQIKLYKG